MSAVVLGTARERRSREGPTLLTGVNEFTWQVQQARRDY